jgi:hypothetical protein
MEEHTNLPVSERTKTTLRVSEKYEISVTGSLDGVLMAAGRIVNERKEMGHDLISARFEGPAGGIEKFNALILAFKTNLDTEDK